MSKRQIWDYLEKFLWVGLVAIAIIASDEQAAKSNDIKLYYATSFHLARGLVPYRDFSLEYPPLAVIPMWLPQLFNPANFHVYRVLFPLEQVLFCFLGWFFIRPTIADRTWEDEEEKSTRQSLTRYQSLLKYYILLCWILVPVLIWRYDLFPALLTFLVFFFVTRERPSFAGIFLALGIATKLYPVVLMPIFSIYYLIKRQYRELAYFSLATIATSCLIIIPFILVSYGEFFSFLEYHELRGIQLETLASGLILLASKMGLTNLDVELNYGAFHLISPWANWLLHSSVLTFIFLGLFGLVFFRCFYSFRREYITEGKISEQNLLLYLVAVLVVFIISNKVFSPQYIVWLMPFAILLRYQEQKLFLGISLLTIALYPFLYDELVNLDLSPILVLNIRNFLMLLFLGQLLTRKTKVFTKNQKDLLEVVSRK
jgi:Glycosyltransferase family 87